MNTLKIFNSNEFGGMRTYCDPKSGEVWFCLADVCKALDLMNPRKVKTTLTERGLILLNARDLDNNIHTMDVIPTEEGGSVTISDGTPTEEGGSVHTMDATPTKDLGGNPNMTFIDEGNLYQVIFQSRKPNAVKFKEWICYEVLPSIHKYGVYITKEVANDDKRLNEAIQAIKEEYKEKIEFADAFLGSEDSAYIGVFADYLTKNGVKIGRNQLFKWFKEKKVLVMYGDEYYPSAKYMKMGLFDLDASIISKTNGRKKISHTVKITPKGMNYFLKKIQPTKAKKAQKQLDFVQMTLFDFI